MNGTHITHLLDGYTRISELNQKVLHHALLVFQEFQRCHIDFLLLKGADLLTRFYGARGIRPMVDVDLLVHEKDLPRIGALFSSLKFHQQIDGNPAYTSPDGSVTFDIIYSIWYLIRDSDLGMLWSRAVTYSYQGVPVKRMGNEDLFLFLTAYAVLQRGSFSSNFAKDIALLIQKESINWLQVLREVTQLHLRIPVHHGLTFVKSSEPTLDLPAELLVRLNPVSWSEKFLAFSLRKLVTNQHTYGISFFVLFLTRPGWRKWTWLWNSLFPQKEFLGYRYGEIGRLHPTRTRLTRVLSLVKQLLCIIPKICWRLLRPQVNS